MLGNINPSELLYFAHIKRILDEAARRCREEQSEEIATLIMEHISKHPTIEKAFGSMNLMDLQRVKSDFKGVVRKTLEASHKS